MVQFLWLLQELVLELAFVQPLVVVLVQPSVVGLVQPLVVVLVQPLLQVLLFVVEEQVFFSFYCFYPFAKREVVLEM